jgi:hypothetical protein
MVPKLGLDLCCDVIVGFAIQLRLGQLEIVQRLQMLHYFWLDLTPCFPFEVGTWEMVLKSATKSV